MPAFWWHRGRSSLRGACGEQQPTFKGFCRADERRCLAVRDGALVLAPADPADEHQQWFKDARLSLWVKDVEGNPVFSLVNKATGLAVQHSLGPNRPVRLIMFEPDDFDESVLWTESSHLRREFGSIRPMHNVRFGLDAIPIDGEDDDNNSVTFVLSECTRGDIQSWKILYCNDEANTTLAGLESEPTCRDAYQHWIQDKRPGSMIKDGDAYPAFALVNRVTGDAIMGSEGFRTVNRVPYNPFYMDPSVLWATSWDKGHGFRCIHLVDNMSMNLDAFRDDGTNILLS
nr:unnamed protein product [Digitaria exilis]